MKVTFLGTGTSQGVPVIGCPCEVCRSTNRKNKRLRSSAHIQVNGKSFVIDTGPDFRQQMLRGRITRLDAVLFTHSHKDHTAGLDDVRAFNFIQKSAIPLYGMKAVLQRLKVEYHYAFSEEKYPGIPQLQLNEVDGAPFTIQGVNFLPLPVKHLHMPVLGFRVGDFSYITDTNYIPDTTLKKLEGTKILVLNALQREKHIAHFNLPEAIEMAQRINAEKTYLTHISHKLGLAETVSKTLPQGINLGYDGLTLTL